VASAAVTFHLEDHYFQKIRASYPNPASEKYCVEFLFERATEKTIIAFFIEKKTNGTETGLFTLISALIYYFFHLKRLWDIF